MEHDDRDGARQHGHERRERQRHHQQDLQALAGDERHLLFVLVRGGLREPGNERDDH